MRNKVFIYMVSKYFPNDIYLLTVRGKIVALQCRNMAYTSLSSLHHQQWDIETLVCSDILYFWDILAKDANLNPIMRKY